MLFGILIFLVIVIVLIVSHELGHFLVAKWYNVRVDEFGVGMPPRVWGIKKGETLYSLNLLPFGGFVKIYGEGEKAEGPRSFSAQSLKVRSLIVVAGVVSNIFMSFVILAFLAWYGVPAADVLIVNIASNSPAEEAGISVGDKIIGVGGNFDEEFISPSSIADYIDEHIGERAVLTIDRGDRQLNVFAVPRSEPPPGEGALGIVMDLVPAGYKRSSIIEAPFVGFKLTGKFIFETLKGFIALFGKIFESGGLPAETVVGPVGIARMAGAATALGLQHFLLLLALISINLAVINILPIPALDGGRLLFFAIEKIARKPVPFRIEQMAHATFFFLLIALLLLITFQDITQFF